MTIDAAPVETRSYAERLIAAGQMDDFLGRLSDEEAEALLWEWSFWRRPAQEPPEGDWDAWFIRAGRGYGKTRTGAETVRDLVAVTEQYGRVGIVAPTAGDARDVIVEGESGILAVHPPGQRPIYEPSKRRLTWPNGAIGTLFSAEEPDRLRGPQHDLGWVEEPSSMARGEEVLDNMRLGLRLGRRPKLLVTGTPRPRPWLKAFADEPVVVSTTGSTYENQANLAPAFIRIVIGRYEGTRLGRQELHAEWLDDVEGALWESATLEVTRIASFDRDDPWRSLAAELTRKRTQLGLGFVVFAEERRRWVTKIGVDPPGETAECGIVVATAPAHAKGSRDHAVVLDDMSISGPPEKWGEQVVAAFYKHSAEGVIVEANQGGDMVRATIHAVDSTVPVSKVHAKVSKYDRAEPVSVLYARGRVHHLGYLGELETQMTSWVPTEDKSPDRLDACVHVLTDLLSLAPIGPASVHSPVARRV